MRQERGLRLATVMAVFAAALVVAPQFAKSAELDLRPRYAKRTVHYHHHRWHRYGCPDRFSCYPLYGAYGPYGGRPYWNAYTTWVSHGPRW